MGRVLCRAGHGRRIAQWSVVAAASLVLAQCSAQNTFGKLDPKYGVTASPRVVGLGQPVPKGGGRYSVGKPYTVAGRVYVPAEDPNYHATGTASWYGDDFHGRLTANGEVFDMESITAAHPTMPLPSYARVTNLETHKSLVVRVNDRGPYHGNRVIDVSVKAAKLLGFHDNGLAKVAVDYVGRAPLEGSDDRQLMATLRNDTVVVPGVRVAGVGHFTPDLGGGDEPRSERRADGRMRLPEARPFRLGERSSNNDIATTLERPEQTLQVPSSRQDYSPRQASSSRQAPVAQREIPRQPQGRVAVVSATPAARVQASASGAPVPTREDAFLPPESAPVSAFSGSRYDRAPSIVSGRGLY
jgi:rare lipoprotein A